MTWILGVLLVLLLGAVVVVAAGRGETASPSQSDDPPLDLPAGRIGPDDLRRLRFNTALRGYRAAEVDELLDRLVRQMEDQDGDSD